MANPNISIVGTTLTEGLAPNKLNFTISISEPLSSELKLNYSTFNGTAISSKDYTALTNSSITFAVGETVKTISVDILNDDINEVDKDLFVNVFIPKLTTFNPSTTDLLVATGVGTITDTLSSSTTTVLADSTTTNKNTIENLTLTGTANINGTGNKLNNILTGNSGTNLLEGVDGQDTLNGKGLADTLKGGLGNDTYIIDNLDTIIEDTVVGAGIDTVQVNFDYTLGTNLENLILTGSVISGTGNQLNNFLTGNNSNNSLLGIEGDDTLQGNDGSDTLRGGLNNDTYIVDAQDTIIEATNAGIDTVSASFSYGIANRPDLENIELLGTGDFNATGNNSNNKLIGNGGKNTLAAGRGDDILNGGSGDDTLNGGDGNDLLEGGLGNDILSGNLGDDIYVLNNPEDVNDIINESANSGTDQVNSIFSYTLQTELEKLVLIGTENINGTGNSVANTLIGNSANNILDGLAGSDVMAGGLGNDTYIVEQNTDTVIEEKVTGTDTVQSSLDYLLGNNVENLILTGTAITGTGNELNNYLVGNSSSNNLAGNAGLDTLDGGAGNDTMIGGTGNDVYVVDSLQDIVTETSTIATETDLVQSLVSYILGNNLENLELIGTNNLTGTGNSLNNKITGNSGNNNLVGGIGNDSLDGGAGTDTLDGVDGNDTLKGGNDNDSLVGGIGNDSLDGGLGSDTLNGGLGDDVYVVDDFRDVITTLSATDGIDTVQSSITYRLGSHLENLTLTGSNNINGIGNELNNIILGNSGSNVIEARDGNDSIDGNAGNDILRGETGDDTLKGNTGNDNYMINSALDVITETSTLLTEIDTAYASVNYTLSNNVENLIQTGTVNLTGTGNSLNNLLMGNSGNNTLKGNDGNDTLNGSLGIDTLEGGLGNDTYIIDNTADVITELANSGLDTAKSLSDYTLAANVENLVLLGNTDLKGTGNSLNNLITGNSGNNELKGGSGDDILIGGAGNDTITGGVANDRLSGGLGADQFFYNSGVAFSAADFGTDRIVDFNRTEGDKIVLGKTTFSLTSAVGNGFSINSEFASVTSDQLAKSSAAKIVYSSETGNIFYNSNGTTLGNEANLATLKSDSDVVLASLSASDFIIV